MHLLSLNKVEPAPIAELFAPPPLRTSVEEPPPVVMPSWDDETVDKLQTRVFWTSPAQGYCPLLSTLCCLQSGPSELPPPASTIGMSFVGSTHVCLNATCTDDLCSHESAAGVQKQGCTWLLVSHGLVLTKDLEKALDSVSRDVTLKFEAFVLHVQCWRLDDAKLLHTVAVQSGFRNSGIAMGKKGKVIVAIRSTHCLEVPLCRNGELLVSNEYLEFLAHTANEKMKDNWSKIERYVSCLSFCIPSWALVSLI
uniref:tRNA wybutosine-synthesizing protein 3 homolog n=1 Tax=Eptatretus burgeri TaxID=7764 RepID=A0A8C4WZP9_EPTBU